MPSAPEPVNPSALRFEQAVVTIALLAGFVFQVALVIPAVAVVLGAAVAGGPQLNGLRRAHEVLFPGPPRRVRTGEASRVTAVTRIVELVLLLVASLFVAFRVEGFAWVFALPVAAITGLAATTGINLVALVYERSQRD